jgi:hypothetical protein
MPSFGMAYGPRVAADIEQPPVPSQDRPTGNAQLGAGLQQAGDALTGLAEHYNEQEARTQATGSLAALQEQLNHRGRLIKAELGEAGVAAAAAAPKQFDEDAAGIRKGITNGRAQVLYDEKARELLIDARGGAEEHALQQTHVVRAANVDARTKAAADAIANHPERADFYIHNALADVRSLAPSKEAADQAAKAWQSDGRATQLQSLIAQERLNEAVKVFTDHGEELGADQAKLRLQLVGAVREQDAQEKANAIFAAAYDAKTGKMHDDVVTKGVAAIADGATQKLAMNYIRIARVNARNEWAQGLDDLHAGLLQKWQDTHSWQAVMNDPRKLELQSRNSIVWQSVLDQMNQDVDRWDRKKREREAGGGATQEQQDRYLAVRLLMNDHPEIFRDPQMTAERFNRVVVPGMTDKDRKKVTELFIKTKDENNSGKLAGPEFGMLLSTVKTALGAHGKDPRNWTPEQSQAFVRALDNVETQVKVWKQQTGRDVTPEKIQEEVDIQVRREEGGLFSRGRTRIEAEAAGDLANFDPEILHDDEARAGASDALVAVGAHPTDEAIDAYLRDKNHLPYLPQRALAPPPVVAPPEAAPESVPAPDAEEDYSDPLGLRDAFGRRAAPSDYYSQANVDARARAEADAAATAARAALAARTPHTLKQAKEIIAARGLTGAAADAQLAAWGYGGGAAAGGTAAQPGGDGFGAWSGR